MPSTPPTSRSTADGEDEGHCKVSVRPSISSGEESVAHEKEDGLVGANEESEPVREERERK